MAGTVLLLSVLWAGSAHAVPSFARQTGMSCSQCHTAFPELTPMGRQFKASGYTLSAGPGLTSGGEGKRTTLELPSATPLGAMILAGFSHTATPQQVAEDGPPAQNGDLALPQELGLFYAGKIAPKVGAFVQLTYESATDHLGLDNTELRFAHTLTVRGRPLLLGATLNNSPTVSDLWNSTPVWGAPFTSSGSAPSPSAATLLEGGLAQRVAGGGPFAYYGGLVGVYAEVAGYRSSPLGVALPLDASTGATRVIDGLMAYWRLAVEKAHGNHSLMLGTFGLRGTLLPGGTFVDASTDPPTESARALVGPGDRFTDVAADAQYQYVGAQHIVTATLTYIREHQQLEATHGFAGADNATDELHSFKGSLGYLFARTVGGRATVATMRGTGDATLYGGEGPRSTPLTGEVFATPWENTRLGLMYTHFRDFNGASRNFDGAGRNASDNDTLYAYLWLAF